MKRRFRLGFPVVYARFCRRGRFLSSTLGTNLAATRITRNNGRRRRRRRRSPPDGPPLIIQHDTHNLALLTRPRRNIQRLDPAARRPPKPWALDINRHPAGPRLDGTRRRPSGPKPLDERGRILARESNDVIDIDDLLEHCRAAHPAHARARTRTGKDLR